jgi:hypothetical protein
MRFPSGSWSPTIAGSAIDPRRKSTIPSSELASLAEVTEATRLSRKLDGAVAVLNAEGTVLARVVSATGGGGDRAAQTGVVPCGGRAG